MFRFTVAALVCAVGVTAASAHPDHADELYVMWIHDNDDTGETHVLVKRADGARITAARKADDRADFKAMDADDALDFFGDVRAEGASANVNIRARGEFDDEFEADMKREMKESGFVMKIDDDRVVIRLGDAFIIEADDDDAYVKIGDEDGGVIIDAKGGDADDALVTIGGMDEDEIRDAIDDLDDTPRSLRRKMKRDLGL